ncbi:hypothetical protein EW146_g6607 [Bondarzewia mesenterica]|uniref:Uncharacterized protein n=1 Tax=Bondarzewia mesenterica TaxID=1095465 RepID=A0A4S4LN46_9AGAM|nr:hypothetical protein EW146_g6607 [Bondarzewia mesenterica]
MPDQPLTSSPDLVHQEKQVKPESCMAERGEPSRREANEGPMSASDGGTGTFDRYPASSSRPEEQSVSQESVWCPQQQFLRNVFLSCSPRKSSTSQSPSTHATAALQPEGVQVLPPSQHATPHSPEFLARHNIKVRDFAYESTLPPIPSIRRVRQLQIGPRPLKRYKRSHPTDDVPFLEGVRLNTPVVGIEDPPKERAEEWVAKPLERKSTEPVIIPEQPKGQPTRAMGYADLSQYVSSRFTAGPSNPRTPFPSRQGLQYSHYPAVLRCMTDLEPGPASQNDTTSSQPPLVGISQETESQVDTPLVTPNGSLHFPVANTSPNGTSQLDSSSQLPGPEDITYSQLGLSSPLSPLARSQLESPDTTTDTVLLRADGSPSPSPRIRRSMFLLTPPPNSLYPSRPLQDDKEAPVSNLTPPLPSTPPRYTTSAPTVSSTTSQIPVPTLSSPARYFLRKRPGSPILVSDPQTSPPRRNPPRSQPKRATAVGSRSPSVTRQSAHARSTSKPTKDSPQARPLKRRAV